MPAGLLWLLWLLIGKGFAAAPTDILFSNHDIVEGSQADIVVATMTAVDADAGDSHLFQLVSGTGGDHNNGFYIIGNKLYLRYYLDRDFESETIVWNVRIRITDSTGLTYNKVTNFYMTDDRLEDADGDGLTEADEEDIHGTSDLDFDSDNDGVGDGAEVAAGTSPVNAEEWPQTSFLGWGSQSRGELGAPVGGGFTTFSTGQNHSLALKTDGGVVAWGGFDTYGQNSVPSGLGDVVEVSAGGDFWVADSAHSVVVRSDGTVTAWGYNHEGNLVLPSNLEHVVSVAAGRSFGLALHDDGTVSAWGYNPHADVRPPAGLDEVVAIAAGGFHSIALRQNGSVVSWGGTFNGTAWVDSKAPAGLTNVVQVSAGRFHTLALRRDGTVVAWGFNSHGQTNVPAGLSGVVAVAAGGFHSLALKSDGSVVAWGENTKGQCDVPVSARGAVKRISAGMQHSLALRQDVGYPRISSDIHLIGAPGEEMSHQITVDDATATSFRSSVLPAGLTLDPATGLISGTPEGPARTTVRLRADTDQGVLSQLAWIAISEGEAPTGIDASPGLVPEGGQTGALVGVLTATDPDAGDAHSFALVAGDGDADNHRFRIQGDRLEVDLPVTMDFEQGNASFSIRLRATDSSLNTYEQPLVLALGDDRNEDADGDGLTEAEEEDVYGTSDLTKDSDGDGFGDGYEVAVGTDPDLAAEKPGGNLLVAWGDGTEGQTSVAPSPGAGFLEVSAGHRHVIGLKMDGTVTAWGANAHGQSDVPPDLPPAVAVSAGDLHSIVLLDDGTVAAWGNDEFGQAAVPEGLENVAAVSAGAYHNLAMLADGGVIAWGNDDEGQCQVPAGLDGVVAVAAGGFHSLALRNDGTVVAWGSDWSGTSTVPAGLKGVVGIAAGGYHSLAQLQDGTVVAWGANDQGQCLIPAGLQGVKWVSAGWLFSVAVRGNGSVVVWGDSVAGQSVIPPEAVGIQALDAGDEFVVAVRQDSGFPGFGNPAPVRTWPGEPISRSLAAVNTVVSGYDASGLPAELVFDTTTAQLTGSTSSGTRNSARITARTDDGLLSTIVWINTADGAAPTNIFLNPAQVMENAPAGTTVGTLTAADPNAGDTFSYELDFAAGLSDSYRFDVAGDQLVTRYDMSADYETSTAPLTVRMTVFDSGGNSYFRVLNVELLDDRGEDADGDGFSEAFEEDELGTSDLTPGDTARNDVDRDGIPSVIEMAFNLPFDAAGPPVYLVPGGGSTKGLPALHLVPDGSGGKRLRMEYLRRTDGFFTYQPQFGDGMSWPAATGTVTVIPVDDDWERCVVEDVGAAGAAKRFGRVALFY